jgi:parallel beta-helix repeat protein
MILNFLKSQSKWRFRVTFYGGLAVLLLLTFRLTPSAQAAPIVFVRPDGSDSLCNGTANAPAASTPNCAFATVLKGVSTVNVGGTVNVGAGTFPQNLTINQTVTLRGAQAGIDARTRPGTPASESILTNGVYVSASNVVIDGFTVQGADGVGDLGPGIYLPGSYSGYQVLNNIIQDNVFGLYLNNSGAAQSVVRQNLVRNNNRPGAASGDGIYSDQGLVNALIDQNTVTGQNISAIDFSSLSAAQTNITVSNNTLSGGRGMIILRTSAATIHSNAITGTDSRYAAIAIYGGVNGLTLTSNTFTGSAGYALTTVNNLGAGKANQNLVLHYNRITGVAGGLSITGYVGPLNAENNWWGCNAGPGHSGCTSAGGLADFNPWLVLRITAAPSFIFVGGASTLTADLTFNSDNVNTSASGFIRNGTPATFAGTLGTVNPAVAGTSGGKAQTTYTAGATPGAASVTATIDNPVGTTITVNPKLNATTALAASLASSVYGQVVTFTATVRAIPPETRIPSGAVIFKDGGTTIGTAALNTSGQAVFVKTTQLGVGNHSITAHYGGDGTFNPSSTAAPLSHTVGKANTTLQITADTPDPSLPGQALTVQYQFSVVAPGAGTPTGIVAVTNGLTNCTGPASGSGSCTLTLTQLGIVTLTAYYAGDGNFNASSDTEMHQVIVVGYLPLIQKNSAGF